MESTRLTLIEAEAGERPLKAWRDAGRLLVDADALERLTGWVLKPEGLCRDDVCVPVRDRSALVVGERIDLGAFAAALHRPAVIDVDGGVVALGSPASERASMVAGARAPDFELPDLGGGSLRLSSIGRKKKLLLAWASW